MSSHKNALIQAKALEEISDLNLLHHYMQELIFIEEGQKATALLPDSVIQVFVRNGIIEYLRGHGGHTLTDKGKEILNKPRE